MKIIVISSSDNSEAEPIFVTKMFENGLETFHLRKPKFSTRQVKTYLNKIPHQFHSRIIIHSHHKLARSFKLKGIHLTKTHKRNRLKTWINIKLMRMKNPNMELTCSFSKIASLFDDDYKYNYVFLSPVFDSISSKYQSGFTEHSLKLALIKTPHKVIARGGIDATRIEKAKELGFYGVALYSTLWQSDDPVNEFISVLEKCRSLQLQPI